jgi:hypothetical protein
MVNPEKLPPLGTQDKRLKQTNKNKTQYVLDTISKESSSNILSRPIVCYNRLSFGMPIKTKGNLGLCCIGS